MPRASQQSPMSCGRICETGRSQLRPLTLDNTGSPGSNRTALFAPTMCALDAHRCNSSSYALVPGKHTADERLDHRAPSIRPMDTECVFKDAVAPVEWWRGWKHGVWEG